MAFDMDSDRCVGFKRRITEIGDTEETPPPLPPQFSTSVCTDNQDDQEEPNVAENKNLSLLSDSKKSKSSSHCDEASEIVTQGNQELGFASGAQQSGEVLGSLASEPSGTGDLVNKVEDFGGEVRKTENCEAGYVCDGEAKQEKFDIEKGGVEETAKEGLLSASADKEEKALVKSEVGVGVVFAKEESKELGKEFESEILLEVKKKQLLEKLEVVLMAEDKTQAERFTDFEGSLNIEVIDQTALIDFNDKCAERKGNKNVNQEVDAKKARRSRRKAKKVFEMNRKNVLVRGETENGCRNIGDGTKKIYSRKEMEALRFTNIVEQRKIWKVIYTGLGAAVAKEYEDLANSKNQKHIRVNLDPRLRIAKQEEAPAILGKYYYLFTLFAADFWFIEFI